MARGSSQATTAATTAQDLANTYSGNAENLFGTLAPMLQSEAAHPPGMAPTDIAAADTAGMQAGGGTAAGAVGQGGLLAARTRNAGAPAAAIAKSARTAGQQASGAALATRLANAKEKSSQMQSGLSGLGNLFSESLTGGNAALGQVAPNVNANTGAENASYDWATDLFNPIMSNLSYSKGGFSV